MTIFYAWAVFGLWMLVYRVVYYGFAKSEESFDCSFGGFLWIPAMFLSTGISILLFVVACIATVSVVWGWING
jgi:hypothetical protein